MAIDSPDTEMEDGPTIVVAIPTQPGQPTTPSSTAAIEGQPKNTNSTSQRTKQGHRTSTKPTGPTQPPTNNPKDLPTYQAFNGLVNSLLSLVPADNKDKARSLAKDIQQAYQQATATSPTTLYSLRKVVAEEVRAALREAPPAKPTQLARTWADIARGNNINSNATIALPQQQPAKIVPARLSREVLVKGDSQPADLAKRNPLEIVQAVNQASSRKGAIAARKLPSGDTIVTFANPATRDWHSTNKDWIQLAFGDKAREARRTFAILVKGLRKPDLQGVTEDDFGQELGLKTLDKIKYQYPKDPNLNWVTVLATVYSQEEAKAICDTGVIFRAQILNCEPYWAPLRPTQCYKCWKWGHIGRYCKKDPLCPRCGTKAHGPGGKEGEALCPTTRSQLPCRCPACGGKHPGWDRECPERTKAKGAAKEAYQHRPRTFESAAPAISTSATPLVNFVTSQEDNHYRPGGQARKRGRPTYIQQASQDPKQGRLPFPTLAIPDQPFPTQPDPQLAQPSVDQEQQQTPLSLDL